MRLLPLSAFLTIMVSAFAGSAQTFQCTQDTAGQRACQAGVNCECRYFRGSAMTEQPAGYRWDCGINRARCVDQVPATSHEPYPSPLPHAVAIDRSTSVDQAVGDNATIGVGVGIGDDIQDNN